MANIVLGVAGAVIGSFTPAGPWIGYAIGSAIGSVLFPGPDRQGPRLNDLKVESSAYGTPIPITYGSARVGGAIIWASDLVEHEHSEGGKGGPEFTTYTYTASFAVSVCEGPIGAIRRIWSAGTLIYDVSGESDQESLPNLNLTFYLGTEDQMPDPTIEAILGAGNVPAYRGQAYVVFTDFDLSFSGNSIAGTQLEFEVVHEAERSSIPPELIGEAVQIVQDKRGWVWGPRIYPEGSTKTYVFAYNPTTWEVIHRVELEGPANRDFYSITYDEVRDHIYVGTQGNVLNTSPQTPPDDQAPYVINRIDAFRGVVVAHGNTSYLGLVAKLGLLNWVPKPAEAGGGELWVTAPGGSGIGGGTNVTVYSGDTGTDLYSGGFYSPVYHYSEVTAFSHNALNYDWEPSQTLEQPGVLFGWKDHTCEMRQLEKIAFAGWGDTVRIYSYDYSYIDSQPFGTGINLMGVRLIANEAAHLLYIGEPSRQGIKAINVDTGEAVTVTGTEELRAYALYYDTDRDILYVDAWNSDGGGKLVRAYDGTTFAFINEYPAEYAIAEGQHLGNTLYLGGGRFVGCESGSSPEARLWTIAFEGTIQGAPITLAEIVADLSRRSGLAPTDIDVTELTDLVDGYVVTRQAPARACIEQLQQAYFFDATESQTVIKFPKRGRASSATIPRTDLAAHVVGEAIPDYLNIIRTQEAELPRFIDLQYIAQSADYQTGNQRAQRMASEAGALISVDLPIVMSDDKAKQVVDAMMFDAWVARMTHQFATTRKYAYLEPTDVVTLEGHVVRLVKKIESGGLIKWEGVSENGYVYSQDSTGATPGGIPTQQLPPNGAFEWALLDIPLLRDEDDSAGFYLAANGSAMNWSGLSLYKSSDGGANYSEIDRVRSSSPMGITTDKLGDFGGGNVFDELNRVTVSMYGGTLSSTTELGVLNGANGAAIESGDGWEIIQFKTATLNEDGTYTLSGLLRGRKGTEWAIDGHAIGDRFVLLSTALSRVDNPLEEYGLERQFKGVAAGVVLASAPVVNFTPRAVAYTCYAPAHLGGGRDADNNVTIQWVRRTRIGGAWLDNVDAQLNEWREEYDVEIMDSTFTTVIRTFSTILDATTVEYTAAQQIADGLTPGNPIYVRVYQVGVCTGRGTPTMGTI